MLRCIRHSRLLLAASLAIAAGCRPASNPPAAPSAAQAADRAALKASGATFRPGPAAGGAAAPGEWPNWRGPTHDGISGETGWTSDWPEEGPAQLWTAQVGTGFSSMAVSQGRLYTMGHRGGNDSVFCFDAATGETLWEHSYACELVDNLHEGGPAATPTVDEGRVYTLSKEGHLFALDSLTGAVIWQQELQRLLGVEQCEWGFSCSPLVLGERLIVEAGRTAALDKSSGELIWQTDAYRAGYGSPVAFDHEGQTLIAVLNNDCLLVVRADDGAEVAQHPWETDYATTATTPIVSGDTIFISSGYNRGCALVKLSGGELEVVYAHREMSNHMNNCVLWRGHLYGFDGNSNNRRLVNLVCMDHASGEIRWNQDGLGCGSLMAADGKLLLLGDQGELAIARAAPDGYEELSRARVLGGRTWTVPVLSGGRIYCRNAAGDLVCLDVSG
ncbi:MAG: PQQ-binding-like beta-propeller repeat protein [Pirellulales bacterium]